MANDRMRLTDVLADIPTFVAVVDAGGFAAASRQLNLTRSAVAKSIARLEERLGGRLFLRTTRTLRLTDDGIAFFERCQRALDELRAGRSQIEAGHSVVSGRLRVSMPVLFGRLRVAPVLTRLAVAHPALDLELHFSDRMIDLVDNRFDLAVRMRSPGPDAGLMTRRIGSEETVVCASPQYLAHHGSPATLAELDAHDAITYAGNGRLQSWRFTGAEGTMLEVSPPSRLHLGDLEAIADAASEGLGLAWLPTWLIDERLRSGRLLRVLQQEPAWISDIHLVWLQALQLPFRMRTAIDALVAGVSRTEPGDSLDVVPRKDTLGSDRRVPLLHERSTPATRRRE